MEEGKSAFCGCLAFRQKALRGPRLAPAVSREGSSPSASPMLLHTPPPGEFREAGLAKRREEEGGGEKNPRQHRF